MSILSNLRNRKLKAEKNLVSEETRHYEKNIKGRAISSIIISILLLVISFFISCKGNAAESDEVKNVIVCITTMLNSIVGIILGIGISTLVLDFFSYVKYTQDRIKDVMIDKTYLNTLSSEEKKMIINNLQSSLYFKNNPIPQESLYKRIHEKVLPLMEKEYLESYYVHTDCIFTEDVIKKQFFHRLEIYSDKEKRFFMPFSVYMKINSDSQIEETYKIQSMCFNGEDMDIQNALDEETSVDEREFTINIPFDLKKGKNIIEYKSTSTVDKKDNVYGHRLTMPCKRYVAEMSWSDDERDIMGYGFGMSKGDDMRVEKYNKMCKIIMNDWSLPGEGVIFIIK